MHRNHQILRGLGVGAEFFTTPQSLYVDDYGTHHSGDNPCGEETDEDGNDYLQAHELTSVTVALKDIPLSSLCECLTGEAEMRMGAWSLVSTILDAHREAGYEGLQGPGEHAQHYRYLDGVRQRLHDEVANPAGFLQEFLPAVHACIEQVETAQEVILQRLRSPEVRQGFWGTTVPGPLTHVVVIASGSARYLLRPRLVDALLLSYGTEEHSGSIIRAILPQEALPRLETWTQKVALDPENTTYQCHVLEERDTPAVVETALTLWDPSGTGSMSDLEQAFQAARRI